ncbi:MAG: nicotinamide-nucleotide amidase [Xanthomonadaceae bacterium]|nr:nicotinamide-nucleotide amidase [Xanthomonadaceae bacterium]
MNDDELRALAEAVGQRLLSAEKTLAFAESCTGGWITKVLTDIPGSSAWLDRGWVVYSNAAKTALGVSAQTLAAHGAVSEEVVAELAQCALDASDANYAVAVSGIAGPDGGTPDKPVGLVWFGWAERDGAVRTKGQHFPGDRDAVRRASVATALQGLMARI